MAAKRKKSGEIWLNEPTISQPQLSVDTTNSLDSDQLLNKYIELKQKIELLEEEKERNSKKLKQLEQTIQEADSKCVNHLKQLTELQGLVNELEIKLEKKSEQCAEAIKQLKEEKLNFGQQEEKWQVFQQDLLTTVRVANDLKSEAEEQSDLLVRENKALCERIATLENELSKLKLNPLKSNGEHALIKEHNRDTLKNCDSPYSDSKLDHKSVNNVSDVIEEQDKIVFRKMKSDDLHEQPAKRIADIVLKRQNADFSTTCSSNSDSTKDPKKLIKQKSLDSVFSSSPSSISQSSERCQTANQRSTTQSLILSGNESNKISVKSLVKTIENANKFVTNSNTVANTLPITNGCNTIGSQQVCKSSSFNSIESNMTTTHVGSNQFGSISTKKSDDIRKSTVLNSTCKPSEHKERQLDAKIEISNHSKLGQKLDQNLKSKNQQNDKNFTTETNHIKNSSSIRLNSKNLVNSKKENCSLNLNSNSISNNEQNTALNNLIKDAGSIRNGLLRWCQNRTKSYDGIEISNFSSSWKDSLVICALLHSLDHFLIPFHSLDRKNEKHNFQLAFEAAQSIGIACNLNIEDLINEERPDWSKIMAYVQAIYNHFETSNNNNNKSL